MAESKTTWLGDGNVNGDGNGDGFDEDHQAGELITGG